MKMIGSSLVAFAVLISLAGCGGDDDDGPRGGGGAGQGGKSGAPSGQGGTGGSSGAAGASAGSGGGAGSAGGAGQGGAGQGGSSGEAGEGQGGSSGQGGAAGAGGSSGQGGSSGDVLARLQAIEGLSVAEFKAEEPTERWFELTFVQPVDHEAAAPATTFGQRMMLRHRSEGAPTMLATTGYSYPYKTPFESELSAMLHANILWVEQRFFGSSVPQGQTPWALLNIRQAAADQHRIVEALKPIYGGPWLGEGTSKGGMASIYHRRFYPDDLAGTVAYVAPHSHGVHDTRYEVFIDQIGDPACRARIVDFQRALLERRSELMPQLAAHAEDLGYTFGAVGGSLDAAFEGGVASLRWAFWQSAGAEACASVPAPDAPPADLFAAFNLFSGLDNDKNAFYYAPYYYQSSTQLGGGDAPLSGIEALFEHPQIGIDGYPPLGVPKPFDQAAMPDVASWLSGQGRRILFIYGQNDPWSAGAFELGGAAESYRFFVPGGNHGSQILDLPEPEKTQAIAAVHAWAGLSPPAPLSEGVRALESDRLAPWRALRAETALRH